MQVNMDETGLNYFEALASQTRLDILALLSQRDMNIKELAAMLDISSSIITKHIRKLESARLISTRAERRGGSRYKVCSLLDIQAEIIPPAMAARREGGDRFYSSSFPVGLFTTIDALPPCGMAGRDRIIGGVDKPAYLFSPERQEAQLLWLDGGYVEYTVPNYLRPDQRLTALEISGEFGTLPDGFGDTQSVALSLNYAPVCTYSALGVPMKEGQWPFHRHGLLVVVRIDEEGVRVNGERQGALTVADLDPECDRWVLRFTVDQPEKDGGGLAIYGEELGSNGQSLSLRVYYR